ncbi:MAG: AsmA-like C-terminal region-containing protein [Bacteroidota bacterium]
MKFLKKILIVLIVLVVLLVGAVIVLPIIFKGDIVKLVKEEANNNLNAKVEFGDFDISLISSFPDFSFYIKDVSVAGIDDFEGDTLVSIGSLDLTIDLMSVINGEEIAIKTISIDKLKAFVKVLKDGKANWDITKETAEEEVGEEVEVAVDVDTAEAPPFKMSLKKFEITNTDIVYDDEEMDFYTSVDNLNFYLKGDFTEDFTTLEIKTTISALTVVMGKIKYLNKVELEINADLDADLVNSKYTFKNNEFRINQLYLGWDGFAAMPGDDIDLDLTFSAKKTDFRNILSLIPAVYATDFEDVKTAGKLALNGYAKGKYTDTALPAFGINLLVENAMFQYPDLPKAVDNINIKVNISNPGGSEDNTVIDVSKFHVELAGNPVDIHLMLKTPVSDPQIDCGFKGEIDLTKIKDVIPLEEGEDLTGLIRSDIVIIGKLSTLENEQYEEFNAVGEMSIADLKYSSSDLPQGVIIDWANMKFSPQYVDLIAFDCRIGKSDIHASGAIENFIAYALTDSAELKGRYQLGSHLFDLNEFMEESEDETTSAPVAETEVSDLSAEASAQAEDTVPLSIIEVPGNIDFTMTSTFDRILYDKMVMTNVSGLLRVKDRIVTMENLGMNLLEGTMTVNGSYDTKDAEKPVVNFDLDISNWNIPQTFETFNTVQRLAPIAENCTGKFSVKMDFVSDLDEHMEPIMNSLIGSGGLSTDKVVVEGSETINKLANVMKNDKYKRLEFYDLNGSFKFKDGRVYLEPSDVKIGNSKAVIFGSNGFDQTLDYTLKMEVPTSEFGAEANVLLENVAGFASNIGVDVSVPEVVNVDILITGTVNDPKVRIGNIRPSGAGNKSIKEQIKEEIKEVVKEKIEEAKEEIKKEVKDKAREEAEKIIKEAEKKAAVIRNEAKKVADNVKKECYANVKKGEDEAKGPVAKIAAKAAGEKLRKECDKKAQKIIDEANKKANVVLSEARERADDKLK